MIKRLLCKWLGHKRYRTISDSIIKREKIETERCSRCNRELGGRRINSDGSKEEMFYYDD